MPEAPLPPRYRSSALARYTDTATFVGVDPYPILRDANIDPRLLDDPEVWLPASAIIEVLERTAERCDRDDFGILLAEGQTFVTIGPVDLLVEHSASVRAIIEATTEFRPLVSDALSLRTEERENTAIIAFELEPYSPQLAALILAHALQILSAALDGAWVPLGVHFRSPAPVHHHSFQRLFACPLSYNDEFDGFSCEGGSVDRISPSAQPLHANYARRLLYLTPEMSLAPSLAERVKATIHLLLRHGTPKLDNAAASMGLSRRSLQRLLASEGTSFDRLLNSVRRNLSTRDLAHSKQPISDVAYNLGFSGVSAFSRWFKSEFGLSPSDWRRVRLHQTAHSAPPHPQVGDAKPAHPTNTGEHSAQERARRQRKPPQPN